MTILYQLVEVFAHQLQGVESTIIAKPDHAHLVEEADGVCLVPEGAHQRLEEM